MERQGDLRGRTAAAVERGDGDTQRLATEWAMPFIPDDGGNGPTDVAFGGGRGARRQVSGCVAFAGRLLLIFGLVMLLGGVFAGLTMRGTSAQRTLQPQIFPVGGTPTVRIASGFGSVRVVAGATDKVEVSATASVRHLSRGLAERALEGYQLDAKPTGANEITIGLPERNPFDGDDVFAGWMAHRSVEVVVTMPATGNLDLKVSAGTTSVSGIGGRITAELNAGSLGLDGVRLADGSSFRVNAGRLELAGELVADASVTIRVNAGGATIVLPRSTDAKLEATANAGNISVSGFPVTPTRIRNSDATLINGYLSQKTDTRSVITVTVNAGEAEIVGRSSAAAPSVPAAPLAPAAPSAPPAPPGR